MKHCLQVNSYTYRGNAKLCVLGKFNAYRICIYLDLNEGLYYYYYYYYYSPLFIYVLD